MKALGLVLIALLIVLGFGLFFISFLVAPFLLIVLFTLAMYANERYRSS